MYVYDYLVRARHHDLMEAAAQSRLTAQIRRQHGRRYAMAAPIRRLARLRTNRITA
jgi:hypothetical protein